MLDTVLIGGSSCLLGLISHSPRSQRDRTRREDRHLKIYELRDNLEVDAVVVARLDRLGRDAADTLSCLRQFASGSVGLISIADRIDLGTPQGRALVQMTAVFSELERGLIAQRTADALGELRCRGRAYGPTPFGFQRAGQHLVVDDAEMRIITRIRRLRGRGKSYQAIAQSLNRAGIPAKRGGLWFAPSVRSVLMTAEKVGRADAEVTA